MLEIITFSLGPMDNNTFLAVDSTSGACAVIDPTFQSGAVIAHIRQKRLNLQSVWLTHAHFDHIAGVDDILAAYPGAQIPLGLHRADLELWQSGGGSVQFGFQLNITRDPDVFFEHGQMLTLGAELLEVRHTPGHTSGHVVIYSPTAGAAFCGDLIFMGSVGRTDLPGGSHATLLESIRTQILTLPAQTRLLPGHGEETCVSDELRFNPYLEALRGPGTEP